MSKAAPLSFAGLSAPEWLFDSGRGPFCHQVALSAGDNVYGDLGDGIQTDSDPAATVPPPV